MHPPPSLARLFPGGRVALRVALVSSANRPLVDEDAGAWRTALAEAMTAHDLSVVAPEDGAAPVLSVTIRRIEDDGRTDAGATFAAVRYDAQLRVRRTTVDLRGAPFVGPDAAPREKARADLVARIAPVVAY